jgi:hypothetical protein
VANATTRFGLGTSKSTASSDASSARSAQVSPNAVCVRTVRAIPFDIASAADTPPISPVRNTSHAAADTTATASAAQMMSVRRMRKRASSKPAPGLPQNAGIATRQRNVRVPASNNVEAR